MFVAYLQIFRPGLFTFQPFINDGGGTVVMTSGLLHPPLLNTSHSISEKYGTLGWLIGRHIISAGKFQIISPCP